MSRRNLYHIIAGQVFDSLNLTLLADQVITVDRDEGIIIGVQNLADFEADNLGASIPRDEPDDLYGGTGSFTVLNLRHLTVLPGFVDAHVHFFLHPYNETSWNDQVTRESLAERTIRATVHARKTLMAGFTTVRDLGTEGAQDADLALRKCLAHRQPGQEPVVVGPRYYCTTRAIVCTGSYGPKNPLYLSQTGVEGIMGADVADGVEECVKAVRRLVGAGADWIKIYGDYRFRSQTADVSVSSSRQNLATFTEEEMLAMAQTGHELGVKVAAHCQAEESVRRSLRCGVDSIEHGSEIAAKGAWKDARSQFWVPTLAAYYSTAKYGFAGAEEMWKQSQENFCTVLRERKGQPGSINIACGGDTGVFPHGENGLELVLMRKLGAPWNEILGWATLNGWKCVRGVEWEGENGETLVRGAEDRVDEDFSESRGKAHLEREVPFGAIRSGWAGDLVGIEGTLDGKVAEFEKAVMTGVRFVMKGGTIYKWNGQERC